jgi:hypothetical protein
MCQFVVVEKNLTIHPELKTSQNLGESDGKAAAILELHQQAAGENFVVQDSPLPLVCNHPGTDGRQFPLILFIGILFESEAAFQAAATAGNLGGIECGFLKFGHPHTNRRHHHHVSITANRFAAVAIIRQQFCFIAHADLSELDARVKLACQGLDQLSEIDPAFGDEVKDHSFAAEDPLDIDELHRQVMLFDQTRSRGVVRIPGIVKLAQSLAIVRRGNAQNVSMRGFGNRGNCLRCGRAKNLATFHTPFGLQYYCIAALSYDSRGRCEFPQETHHPMPDEELRIRTWGEHNSSIPVFRIPRYDV